MKKTNKVLGKGLDALFAQEGIDVNTLKKVETTINNEEVIEVGLELLRPNPFQPRKYFDEDALAELTSSIKEHGVFQPIIIKPSIKGYEIIAGERRYRASIQAGLDKIPAVIREFTDQQMMEIALLENLQREDLSAIEEASAYVAILDKLDITHEDLSKRVGKSRSHITNLIGLLKLPELVQNMVINKDLSMGHARVLSKLGNYNQMISLANKIVNEGLTVRQLEAMNKPKEKKIKPKSESDYEYKYFQSRLRDKFGTKVKIDDKKISINYSSVDDLNRLLDMMGVLEDE